jgi:uncharacterized protein (DUF488 family)
MAVRAFTIGFTQSTAQDFFDRLARAGVRKIIDVRLHNTSQLAGFAKADDLRFFLKKIGGTDYVHMPLLAPTDAMLTEFKKRRGDWDVYQGRFLALMAERRIEAQLAPGTLDGACLLCSEATPHHCHRRLVCEYLHDKWNGGLTVEHL